jgi:hypothetical protein
VVGCEASPDKLKFHLIHSHSALTGIPGKGLLPMPQGLLATKTSGEELFAGVCEQELLVKKPTNRIIGIANFLLMPICFIKLKQIKNELKVNYIKRSFFLI